MKQISINRVKPVEIIKFLHKVTEEAHDLQKINQLKTLTNNELNFSHCIYILG